MRRKTQLATLLFATDHTLSRVGVYRDLSSACSELLRGGRYRPTGQAGGGTSLAPYDTAFGRLTLGGLMHIHAQGECQQTLTQNYLCLGKKTIVASV
jgi:hypothetical protein